MDIAAKIIEALVSHPAMRQFQVLLTNFAADAATVKNEVLGAKTGFQSGTQALFVQLNRMEANQRNIMRALNIPLDVPQDQARLAAPSLEKEDINGQAAE